MSFLDSITTQSTNKQVVVPYNVAFLTVKALLNVAINQYEHLEATIEAV